MGAGAGPAAAIARGGLGSISEQPVKRRTPAQATVFFVVMLPLFLAVAGLALDASNLFVQRTQLQATADAASRAWLFRLDEAILSSRADGVVRRDPTAAREAAMYYAMYNGALAE